MKKIVILLLVSILSVLLVSCGDDAEELDPDLNIGEDGSINYPIIDYPQNK